VLDENADQAYFVSSYNPWFARGGEYNHGLNSGVFAFSNDNGRTDSWLGFRVVIEYYF